MSLGLIYLLIQNLKVLGPSIFVMLTNYVSANGSPFHSVSFLLPMLCQITMENDGCRIFAAAGAFEAVRTRYKHFVV